MALAPADLENAVRRALATGWGITARLERLPGENVNFRVVAENGSQFVAKVAGDQQPPEFVDLEYAALTHADQSDLGLDLPLILENKFGNYETVIEVSGTSSIRLRLLKFIPGKPWSESSDISPGLRFNLGFSLARFDLAMQGFDHPMAHRTHRWDLARLDQHRESIALVDDVRDREVLTWAFDQYTNLASPVLLRLSRQFIHGDANPENILVRDGHVVGLVDFGDCCWNPPVCELAICLAYQMMDQPDPWAAAEPVIAGFEDALPLTDDERGILAALVCGRLANTLAVAAERRRRDPEHPNWFVSVPSARALLERLRERPAFPA